MHAIKELSDSHAAQDNPIKVDPDRDLTVCLFVISLTIARSDEAVMIFDSMAVLQSMTKIIHFKDVFINRATHLMKGFVFDSFLLRGVTQVQNSMKMSCHN